MRLLLDSANCQRFPGVLFVCEFQSFLENLSGFFLKLFSGAARGEGEARQVAHLPALEGTILHPDRSEFVLS